MLTNFGGKGGWYYPNYIIINYIPPADFYNIMLSRTEITTINRTIKQYINSVIR